MYEDTPIGFCQYYDCSQTPEGFEWDNEPQGTFAIDYTLCVEHGLSVIHNPACRRGKHYGAWLGDARPPSFQNRLRETIDAAPVSFGEFLTLMREAGYIINTNRKYITFLAPDQKQPTRMDTLRGNHTESAVRERIRGYSDRSSGGMENAVPETTRKPSLLIDIESKLQQGKGTRAGQKFLISSRRRRRLSICRSMGLTATMP